MTPPPARGSYALSQEARTAAIHALRDYEMETRRYVRETVYKPCHATCEHCKHHVARFDEMRADLTQRLRRILEAIDALTVPPPIRPESESPDDN